MTTTERLAGLVGLGHAKLVAERLAGGTADTHAILFYGPPGSGKTELANLLAQAWLCTAPTPNGACGLCASCVSAQRGTHSDLLRVEPQPPSHIIRLSAIYGNEETLSVQQLFRTPPLMARNKVAIVHEAERMNADAANAFLKTLEEPPPTGKLILTSASPGALLPTILSRCLAVACELPSDQELRAKFPTASDDGIRLAAGSVGRLKSQLERTEVQVQLWDLANHINHLAASEAIQAGERLRSIADTYEKATGEGARRAQAECLAELGLMLRIQGFYLALAPIADAHRRILGNGNAALVLDQLFTRIVCKSKRGNS